VQSGSRLGTARRKALEIWQSEPLFLDTETTGLGPRDQVIEVAVIDHRGAVLLDQLVRPSIPIPAEAQRIHGIRDADVRAAPWWHDILPQVAQVVEGRAAVMYNAPFDLRMMEQSARLLGLRWRFPAAQVHCLMELVAEAFGRWDPAKGAFRYLSLEAARRRLGIAEPNAHRALQDALLTRQVLMRLAGIGA
jgi:DNA polymerase-3 subunit epsilon